MANLDKEVSLLLDKLFDISDFVTKKTTVDQNMSQITLIKQKFTTPFPSSEGVQMVMV